MLSGAVFCSARKVPNRMVRLCGTMKLKVAFHAENCCGSRREASLRYRYGPCADQTNSS